MDVFYSVQCTAALPIGVLFRLQVGLENRFEHQDCRRFHCPIPDRGDDQCELHLSSVRLWDRLRSVIRSIRFEASASKYSRNDA